jgi:hypothetical protein
MGLFQNDGQPKSPDGKEIPNVSTTYSHSEIYFQDLLKQLSITKMIKY